MTARQWIDANIGKYLDFDGYYGYQCKDVINYYSRDVVGVRFNAGNAIDAWTTYPTGSYTKIVNTPSFVPKCGDIMIWGKGVGTYGHIAVCTGNGDTNWFESLDQNWPFSDGKTPCKLIRHNYNSVLGVLRPNKDVNFDQAAYDAAQAAAQEAARVAKEAEDARIAKEAAEAARKAQEEADRIAAEKAEADRIAKEEAEKAALEQAKLLEEQKRLEEELKAKQEAEKKENTMLKGYRTYVALGLAAVAQFLPLLGLDKTISEAIVTLLLAAAAWFRAQA